MEQLEIFPRLYASGPLARSTDPTSSHKANLSISKNGTLARLICDGVMHSYRTSPLDAVTDDYLLEYIETHTAKRQQRNVIARARGILERNGYFQRVPGDRVSVLPTYQLLDFYKENNEPVSLH